MTQHSNASRGANGNGLLAAINHWPRLTRIILSMFVTVFIVGFVWLAITLVFGVDTSSNTIVRLLVIFGTGLATYLYGWQVLVGFDDQPGRWHATQQTVWYLLAGVVTLVLDVVILIGALLSTDLL
jgi:hypothetical protein